MNLPQDLSPVLAKIRGVNDLGTSEWWEVVYYDSEASAWCSYAGSNTFGDGEVVVQWKYCRDITLQEVG